MFSEVSRLLLFEPVGEDDRLAGSLRLLFSSAINLLFGTEMKNERSVFLFKI